VVALVLPNLLLQMEILAKQNCTSGKSLLIKYNNDFSNVLESSEIGYTIEKSKFSKDMMYFISKKDDNFTFSSFDLKNLKNQ